MLEVHAVGEPPIIYARARHVFDMGDVQSLALDLAAGKLPGLTLGSSGIMDVRAASLSGVQSDGIKAYLRRRRELGPTGQEAGFLAMVAGDVSSFGELRMFGALSDIDDIRPEDRTLVSQDLDEAARWLAAQMSPEGPSAEALTHALAATSTEPPLAQYGAVTDPSRTAT